MSAHVYLIRKLDGTPLYVGCTGNLKRRINEHRRDWLGRGFGWDNVMVLARAYPTRREAEMAEWDTIREHLPRRNIMGVPGPLEHPMPLPRWWDGTTERRRVADALLRRGLPLSHEIIDALLPEWAYLWTPWDRWEEALAALEAEVAA